MQGEVDFELSFDVLDQSLHLFLFNVLRHTNFVSNLGMPFKDEEITRQGIDPSLIS